MEAQIAGNKPSTRIQEAAGRSGITRSHLVTLVLLSFATGAAGALWAVAAIFDDIPAGVPMWFLTTIVASGWPSFLSWHYCTAMRRQSGLQATNAAYTSGYADGYINGLTDRFSRPSQ